MVPSRTTPRANLRGRRPRIGHRPEQGRHVPRDGAIIFGDLIGKLDVLYVHCGKCSRAGRYRVQDLIDERGRDGKIIDWLDEITADCPKNDAPHGARMPRVL